MKKKIAVVGGSFTSESDISKNSALQVSGMIDKNQYDVYAVFISHGDWMVQMPDGEFPIDKSDFSFTYKGEKINFDCVYNSIHGTPGEDGQMPGYWDLLGIPYTSCGVFAGSLTFNKYATKTFLKTFDVKTADAVLLRPWNEINVSDIVAKVGLPCFVKPNNGGSSFGVSKVKTENEMIPAIEKAFGEDTEVIIERFVKGTEVSVGAYEVEDGVHVLPITEIRTKNEFFDYQAKYESGFSEEITPAELSDAITKACKAETARIYKCLGCFGICRVDFIITDSGELNFLEINTNPGMSKASIVPKQMRAEGLNEAEVFSAIIEHSIKARK
ncbi:MAG: D-alanine--D-alanine ligase [Bacteroidales bacterium]|nr:D-alanine--D-alanine ligase [Bacteroidales bacterium]